MFSETLFSEVNPRYLIGAAAAVLLLFLLILIIRRARSLPKKIASKIRRRKYISMENFLDSWHESKEDFPGCYVILIYDKRLIVNPMNYDDIYVGQSVNVRHRVFSHLMGHGNGNVYYGLKSGCRVYLIICKLRRRKLNRAEKELIDYFHATSSLNMTRGGSARR
ncbi:MAG: GIY-YIG nuclease family protein [Parasporobacterium sp.]|nr:GIY-YIG nuclease family protein [Parasporobacterium sp.]